MISDEIIKDQIINSVKKSYSLAIQQAISYMDKIMPIDQLNEKKIPIENKSDFMKGWAISSFYIMSNQMETALKLSNLPPLSQELKEFRSKLQEEYARKILNKLDFKH